MTERIANLRANEAAYRRQILAGGSAIATRRLFPARLVRMFWWVLVGVCALTAIDVASHETGLVHAVETAWRNIR